VDISNKSSKIVIYISCHKAWHITIYLSIHCHVLYHDALLVVLSSLGSPSTVLLLVHTIPLKNVREVAIVKKDLCNENNDKYWFVENHYSVEAWFVPSPNKNSEDDGIW
jgi:hypothetical protein